MAEKYVVTKAKMDALAQSINAKSGSTGAVGGLIEIDDFEVGSLNLYTPLAMEQAYAEVLLVLQNWVREAMEKEGSL